MIYTPKHFAEDDRHVLLQLMRNNSFATVICGGADDPVVTHVPVLVDEAGQLLQCHVARANPLWRELSADREVLFIFHGPHHYVSPGWYEDAMPSVPTWNYAAVHVHAVPAIIEDRGRVESMLRALVTGHESELETPWIMDLPADYLRKMIDGIVAFDARITRMVGKFKLSQNRPPADRHKVISKLHESGGDSATELAALMQRAIDR